MGIEPVKWFVDKVNPNLIQMHALEKAIYTKQSKYQHMEIVETTAFGMCLILDGKIQSCEADEFIYHESLVQPAMVAHPKPENVFIAGGGEGATLREVLKHKSVKHAVMIDIDKVVVNTCKKYLPKHHQGSFDDKRTELRHEDARKYLENTDQKFDVIIIDLPDPIEEGPAYLCYTQEFYHLVKERLTANGIMSVQSGSAAYLDLLNFSSVHKTLESVFPIVSAYQVHVPSFGSTWGFCLASSTIDATRLSSSEIDERIAARKLKNNLSFYDGETHRNLLSLPRYIRDAFAAQTRLITDDQPLYIFSARTDK